MAPTLEEDEEEEEEDDHLVPALPGSSGGSNNSLSGTTISLTSPCGGGFVLTGSMVGTSGMVGTTGAITVETVSLPDLSELDVYRSGSTTTILPCGATTTTTRRMAPGEIYFFSANSYVVCVQRGAAPTRKVRDGVRWDSGVGGRVPTKVLNGLKSIFPFLRH